MAPPAPTAAAPPMPRRWPRSGISSLEIDMWAPRGLKGGLDRPKSVADTFPDVFGAFRYLTTRPEFDALRIGVHGLLLGRRAGDADGDARRGAALSAQRRALRRPCAALSRVLALQPRRRLRIPRPHRRADPVAMRRRRRLRRARTRRRRCSPASTAPTAPAFETIVYPGATHAFDQVDEAGESRHRPARRIRAGAATCVHAQP